MGLEKAIEHEKEHREPYFKSKAFDASCRNHGGCTWCESNRRHSNFVRKIIAEEQLKEYMKDI